MLLGTLRATLLENLLARKEIIRAGSGKKKEKGLYERALEKNGIFNAASSFNKLIVFSQEITCLKK